MEVAMYEAGLHKEGRRVLSQGMTVAPKKSSV